MCDSSLFLFLSNTVNGQTVRQEDLEQSRSFCLLTLFKFCYIIKLLFSIEYQLPCLINQYTLARLGYGKESMADINVQDCDQCLNPYWEDQLENGLCPTCGQNDLASFFE